MRRSSATQPIPRCGKPANRRAPLSTAGRISKPRRRRGIVSPSRSTSTKAASTGRPVLLEIVWPDDKPRMMGLYMYPETKQSQHRDRLQGGIQSGNEYPLSGKMQSVRYLFYPGVKRYHFEARTLANGMPAAVAAVRLLPIEGELPKLKINYPENLPHRQFGNMDEDQTFETNLNYDDAAEKSSPFRTQRLTDRLLGYLDYTGQEAWNYPVLRYHYSYYPQERYVSNGACIRSATPNSPTWSTRCTGGEKACSAS